MPANSFFRLLGLIRGWLPGRPTGQSASALRRRSRRPSTTLSLELLEDRLVPATINLTDMTALTAGNTWVAGFNGTSGSSALQPTGSGAGAFTGAISTGATFYQIGSGTNQINSITLSSGNGRLIFAVSTSTPNVYPVSGYSAYPFNTYSYVPPSSPYDIVEFTYAGFFNVTQVDSFGENLSLSDPNAIGAVKTVGANTSFSRSQIGLAFQNFMINDLEGQAFKQLFYTAAQAKTDSGGTININVINSQYLAMVSPKDWLAIKTPQSLASYWDSTLKDFFKDGNYLSISTGPFAGNRIYSGKCSGGVYTLTDPVNNVTYTFASPGTGLKGALYVFGQPNAPAGDAGLLQFQIWQALERGVALNGISSSSITNGQSSTAWSTQANWYQHIQVTPVTPGLFPNTFETYDSYAKFLHYSDINGKDSRVSGGTPINYGNLAYGFSADEGMEPAINTNGGDTITVTLGPWGTRAGGLMMASQPHGTKITQAINFLVQLVDSSGPAGQKILVQVVNSTGKAVASYTLTAGADGTASSSGLPLGFLQIGSVGTYHLHFSLAGSTGTNPIDSDPFTVSPVVSVLQLLQRSRYR